MQWTIKLSGYALDQKFLNSSDSAPGQWAQQLSQISQILNSIIRNQIQSKLMFGFKFKIYLNPLEFILKYQTNRNHGDLKELEDFVLL